MSVMGRRIPPAVLSIQKRLFAVTSTVILIAGLIVALSPMAQVSAAQITTRSLTLQSGTVDSDSDGINDGGSMPSGVVRHLFTFTIGAHANLGSIKFEYCTVASGTCVAPTGLSTTTPGATLGTSTGVVFTSIVNPSANVSYVSKTAAAVGGTTVVTVRLDGVKNPSATNTTFYTRISTYASTDTTGSPTDSGVVAASTANQIQLTGIMPESLIFCTGQTIGLTGAGVPDCTTATSGAIAFDQLFSPLDTATATSQLAASTNGTGGYSITVNGPTLTSGSNTIPAITASGGAANSVGVGQFGLNLVANTTTTDTLSNPLGSAITPASNGTNFKANPQSGYATAETFKFVSGDVIAKSDNGTPGSPVQTDAQRYTASYIVNVSGSQPAGTYVTTLTYVCTATF